MKITYRQRLFLYFALLFTAFTIGVAVFEHSRELSFKREALEEKLDTYSDLIQSVLAKDTVDPAMLTNGLPSVLPVDLRITIIDHQGKVLYDNAVENFSAMENHSHRVEIQLAAQNTKGSDVRESASNHHPYLYYAKKYGDKYIRVALPYNIQLKQFLKTDNAFLYFLGAVLLIFLWLIHRITSQFGASIRQLRDFALQSNTVNSAGLRFPNDELGEIGTRITENYLQLEANRESIALEKQKLLQHIQISEEGICFFSYGNKVEFHNGLFIQYLNQLTDDPVSSAAGIFSDTAFAALHRFLEQGGSSYFETQISKRGKIFSLRVNMFDDKSFEIILNDVTRQEKTRQLKQEMTGNIAHELRTPVTGIRAYLETVLEQNIPDEKKHYFIQQAFNQTLTLSEMIKDVSLIAKMEEAPGLFELETINISDLLKRLKEEMSVALVRKNIEMSWQLPDDLAIKGNPVLLYSIFKNLTENAIRYAGEHIKINISVFNEGDHFYYFSFYDTGVGVENEEHLNRLFERFYRVQEGRTRDTGGSGLGLSIVKNAVHFHKGNITAKNRREGGLEFIFQLHK